MRKLSAALLLATLLAGCVAEQSRDNPNRELFDESSIEQETRRHGASGYEIARIWNTGSIARARQDYTGASNGLEVNEFYQIEIAENPDRPTVLTPVGYVRMLKQDRGELMIYEFYNQRWARVAYLSEDGSLYSYARGGEEFLGKHQLDGAVRVLFPAPSGYGYDSVLQDESIANMKDPAVATTDPRGRGVSHTSHKAAPAIVNYTLYRPGEAALLADRYNRDRFYEREREKYERIREDQGYKNESADRNMSSDTRYEWKDGNPVDKDGRPVRPHHKERD